MYQMAYYRILFKNYVRNLDRVPLSGGTNGESGFLKLFEMILDIIPTDIISPFQTGNALQVVSQILCKRNMAVQKEAKY